MFRDDTLRGFDGVMFVSNSEEGMDDFDPSIVTASSLQLDQQGVSTRKAEKKPD